MRESNYWFRIFKELEIGNKEKCETLVKESDELKRILGSIVNGKKLNSLVIVSRLIF